MEKMIRLVEEKETGTPLLKPNSKMSLKRLLWSCTPIMLSWKIILNRDSSPAQNRDLKRLAKIVFHAKLSCTHSFRNIFSFIFTILYSIIAKRKGSLNKLHSSCFSLFVNEIESSLNDSSIYGEIISANQMTQIWRMTHCEAKRVIHLREKCLKKTFARISSISCSC